MLTHRERRSRQAVAVTAMALAMGFLSVADAYAQSRRGNGFAAQSQTRRPFTVAPKAPRVTAPSRRPGGFQRINPPKAPRVTPKFVAPKAPRGNGGAGNGRIFAVPPKAPRVPGGRQQIVAPKAPRINVPKAPRVQPGRQELVASKAPRAGTPVQQTVPVPIKRSAKPKVVKKVVKRTTVRKKRPYRKHGYRYYDHHHGYDGPYGYRGYHRSYAYRPYHGGYGGGYAHCR